MWHFVDGRFAEETADFGDAGVVFDFVVFFPFFFVFGVFEEFLEFFVGIDDHGAEFEHLEGLAVFADTGLCVDDTMKIACANIGEADNNIERNQKDNADKAKHYVESAFKKNIHFLLRFYNYITFGYVWARFSLSRFQTRVIMF